MLYPNCAPAWEYVAIPLGSSSAAPVMRPGPNCFTRGSSAMLLSSLTIAVLQKRTISPTREKTVEIEGSKSARTESFEPLAPPAFGGTALRRDLKRYRRQCAGAAEAALTTTRATTHEGRPVRHITGATIDRYRRAVKEKMPKGKRARGPGAFFSASLRPQPS